MDCERCYKFLLCWYCEKQFSCNETKNVLDRQGCFECEDENNEKKCLKK